ncbi:MAG: tetratricopeptide repeat protein [Bacteroidetes bacterium]|nr:MAG: tetratricopeptide repeat protein [Bacteroidota bacterium]
MTLLKKFRFYEINTAKLMITTRSRQFVSYAILCVLLASPFLLQAQSGEVNKLMQKAALKYHTGYMTEAKELYESVLNIEPSNFEAAYRLGQVNTALEDYQEALRWYRKATEIDPDRNDTLYLDLGMAYKRLANYRKAREAFESFKSRHRVQDEYFAQAEKEIEGCDLAEAAAKKTPRFSVSPVTFNSAAGDQFPAFLDQRQEDVFLAFGSYRREGNRSKKNFSGKGEPAFEDIFLVILENDSTFGDVENVGKPINKKFNDGTPAFTPDGLTMYYTVCNSRKNRDGCSIFESRYNPVKKRWGKPVLVEGIAGTREVVVNSRGKTVQMPTDDRQPSISRDGRTMYFVSSREGGQGGFDIWYSRKLGSRWGEPQNLGPVINTPFNEISPFINRDGDRLYFASTGHAGFGGYDLYESKGQMGSWGTPKNLGSPMNSSYDDFGSIWLRNDSLVYFTSNRPGGLGSNDIYRGKKLRLDPSRFNIAVQGLIRDKNTKQPIPFATAILFEYQPDSSLVPLDTFLTDQTAFYNFPLQWQKKYKILGNAPEYFANDEDVSTVGIEDDAIIERNIDIELEPIVIDEPIVLQNIYYDFDEYYLRPDAVEELNNLIELLTQNDNIVIQMGSHTDTNGTEVYNIGLSENRAKAAVKYLIENGIHPARLTWKGYGETSPLIYPEMSDEDEQANRRTEFRIISIEFEPPEGDIR